MTALTLGAIAPFMLVVFLVTVDAGIGCKDFLAHRQLMAIIASNSLMAAVELETSAGVVIEIPNLPIAGVVAIFAL